MFNKYIADKKYINDQQKRVKFTLEKMKKMGYIKNNILDYTNYLSADHFMIAEKQYFGEVVTGPIGTITKTNYAYIYVPHYVGRKSETEDKFSYVILNILYKLYAAKPIGWIFDLRYNTGGIIYSFILAFLSVLDNFSLTAVNSKKEKKMELTYDGMYLYYKYTDQEPNHIGILPPVTKLKLSNVHVLIDNNTASCGEILTYLLKKQYNATIYGPVESNIRKNYTYGIITWMDYVNLPNFDNISDEVILSYPKLYFDFDIAKDYHIVADKKGVPFDIFGMF